MLCCQDLVVAVDVCTRHFEGLFIIAIIFGSIQSTHFLENKYYMLR